MNNLSIGRFREFISKGDVEFDGGFVDLRVVDNYDYLDIRYDYINDVFVKFEMDIDMCDKVCDNHIECAREYLFYRTLN